jgi:hypothetical protein
MAKERKALIVHYAAGESAEASVQALNDHLADDWTLISTAAMGGAGAGPGTPGPEFHFAVLVVLEREEKRTVGGFRHA